MTEHEQEIIALEEAANAAIRILERGVQRKHMPGSALLMVGLHMLESSVSRKAMAIWLEELARKYRYSVH